MPDRQDWRTVQVSLSRRPDAPAALARVRTVLRDVPNRIVACSGGIDSLILAHVAHAAAPATTRIAHTVTPAVPGDGTARVVDHADRADWRLDIVRSGEFDDERYLENPTERCYFCKSNLYDAIAALRDDEAARERAPDIASAGHVVILSGANLDDLGEYRPGLEAAAERGVRHPFVEARVTKSEIRAIARDLGLAEADLPASPCLASRLYTGTRVTPTRLRAVEAGEATIRDRTGIAVVRCRVRETSVLVEVADIDRDLVTASILADVSAVMRRVEPTIERVELDGTPYAPGRAVVR